MRHFLKQSVSQTHTLIGTYLDSKGTPMFKKVFVGLLVIGLMTTILSACSIYDQATLPKGPEAHMSGASFVQSSVNIKKGDSLTLIDDVAAQHIIKNGTWDGNTPKPAAESGAPSVDVTLNGNDSATIGPFNTAGTYKLYCTIHPGMNLTVNVQ
jgi:plastocyanin